MRMDTSIDDFYKNDGIATFVDKMSSFLGIDLARLKVVGVR